MTDHDTRDSFVVRLRSGGRGAGLTMLRGSIEHVQSRDATRFLQIEEMLEFMESHLGLGDGQAPEPTEN
ncbi:MAG TPA: hypothetical protein VG815_00585 [Chloroflexota bacterium]|jgi:hypothetical protein|nr:hypothetical protein [Chloroflexota bacterium]